MLFKNKTEYKLDNRKNWDNPSKRLSPVFLSTRKQEQKSIVAWEYLFLVNDKIMSTLAFGKNEISVNKHFLLVMETMAFAHSVTSKKEKKTVKPIVLFERLEFLAKRLDRVSIMIFHDNKHIVKYEFAMRLVYKKGKK